MPPRSACWVRGRSAGTPLLISRSSSFAIAGSLPRAGFTPTKPTRPGRFGHTKPRSSDHHGSGRLWPLNVRQCGSSLSAGRSLTGRRHARRLRCLAAPAAGGAVARGTGARCPQRGTCSIPEGSGRAVDKPTRT
jgi:hypothetical protein